jgi:hypothetical protein
MNLEQLLDSLLMPPSVSLMTLMPLPRTRSRSACGKGRRSSIGGEELQSRISACAYSFLARTPAAALSPAAARASGVRAVAAAAAPSVAENLRRFMPARRASDSR